MNALDRAGKAVLLSLGASLALYSCGAPPAVVEPQRSEESRELLRLMESIPSWVPKDVFEGAGYGDYSVEDAQRLFDTVCQIGRFSDEAILEAAGHVDGRYDPPWWQWSGRLFLISRVLYRIPDFGETAACGPTVGRMWNVREQWPVIVDRAGLPVGVSREASDNVWLPFCAVEAMRCYQSVFGRREIESPDGRCRLVAQAVPMRNPFGSFRLPNESERHRCSPSRRAQIFRRVEGTEK
jgi:hypothetical protein